MNKIRQAKLKIPPRPGPVFLHLTATATWRAPPRAGGRVRSPPASPSLGRTPVPAPLAVRAQRQDPSHAIRNTRPAQFRLPLELPRDSHLFHKPRDPASAPRRLLPNF